MDQLVIDRSSNISLVLKRFHQRFVSSGPNQSKHRPSSFSYKRILLICLAYLKAKIDSFLNLIIINFYCEHKQSCRNFQYCQISLSRTCYKSLVLIFKGQFFQSHKKYQVFYKNIKSILKNFTPKSQASSTEISAPTLNNINKRRNKVLHSRCLMESTDQADPNCFYFRIL